MDFKMNSKGAFPVMGVVIAIIGLLIGGFALGYIPMPTLAVTPTGPQGVECPAGFTGTPEISFISTDFINPGTVRNAFLDVNFHKSNALGTISFSESAHLGDDSLMDVAPNDQWNAYVTDGDGGNATYYGTIVSSDIYGVGLCQEAALQVAFPVKTVGTLDFIAFNTDDGATNATGDTQAIGSGATVLLDLTWQEATADACWHSSESTKPIIIVYDYNDSTYDSVTIEGTTTTATGVPTGHTTGDVNLTVSKAWLLPNIGEVCDFAEINGLSVKITADSGTNPQDNGSGGHDSDDIRWSVYVAQLMQDDAGNWSWEYRDKDDGTAIIAADSGRHYTS